MHVISDITGNHLGGELGEAHVVVLSIFQYLRHVVTSSYERRDAGGRVDHGLVETRHRRAVLEHGQHLHFSLNLLDFDYEMHPQEYLCARS